MLSFYTVRLGVVCGACVFRCVALGSDPGTGESEHPFRTVRFFWGCLGIQKRSGMLSFYTILCYCGGSAPITIISDKQIVSANKFLVSDEFQAADKGNMFKWARTPSEVKEAEKLTEEFLRDVEAAKRQADEAKHMAKHRRCLRTIKLGEECKLHGGPVSDDNLDLLDVLDEGNKGGTLLKSNNCD